MLLDVVYHLEGQCVRREIRSRRHHARPFTAKGGAVFLIEVPPAASRLAILHENVVTLAHVPIEVLHDQRLALLAPGGEFVPAAKKVRVAVPFERHARACTHLVYLFLRAVFSGFDHLDAGRLVAIYRRIEPEAETGRLGPVDEDVVDRITLLFKPVRMMPHG